MTQCFWIEPVMRERLTLRRYRQQTHGDCPIMPNKWGYHNAHAPLFDVDARIVHDENGVPEHWDHDGPKRRNDVSDGYTWPERCACGYVFVEEDQWQVFGDALYQRTDMGEVIPLRAMPPGAMWNAWWYGRARGGYFFGPGEDGISLMVRLPNNGDWFVDGRASNCTMPEDLEHRCWIRHGDPRTEPVTVDKNGHTCAAGAGSILSGSYHGFLQNGQLT